MRKPWLLVSAFLVAVSSMWSFAQTLTPDQETRIQKLETIIKKQDQRIQELRGKLGKVEAEKPSREYTEQIIREYMDRPEAQEASTVTAGWEKKGFFIKTADGNMELYMSGWLQFGLGVFENHSFDRNSFYPNDVSVAFDAYLLKDWHARVQLNFAALTPDGNDSNFQSGAQFNALTLWDAYIEYLAMPEFKVRVGQTHVPFGIAGQYAEHKGLSIWNEPFVAAWSHGRDPGIMAYGTMGDMLEYKLMIANGEGANRLNLSDDMLMAGQVRAYLLGQSENPNTFVHVGLIRSRNAGLTADGDNAGGSVNGTRLRTPWGRRVFDGTFGTDATRGWLTGVDAGLRYDDYLDPEKVNHIRFEMEYMHVRWQRELVAGRRPFLYGHGFLVGSVFKHNFTPDVKGAGIFAVGKFSYTDLDNKDTNDAKMGTNGNNNVPNLVNINGQRILTHTFGFGYAFNQFVSAQFNWVIVDLKEKNIYGGPKNRTDRSDDVEHGWFFQVTAEW